MAADLHAATWIAAPPEHVWRVLADFAAYPEWNPFIVEASGALLETERLRVRIQPHGFRPMTVRPVVRWVAPGQELRWRGSLLAPGLFDGEHAFRLQPLGRGTHFVQRERFTGLLVPLLLPLVRDGTQHGFEAMNAALRTRAEQTATVEPVGPLGMPPELA